MFVVYQAPDRVIVRPGITALAIAIAGILSLGSCAPTSDYGSEAALALQSRVLTVTESSAAGDYVGALTRLDELEVSLRDAFARGEVTQERFDSILAAITLVRADLEAAIAAKQDAEQTPAPAPAPAPGPPNGGNGNGNENGKNENGNGNGKDD